jgi:hypothetical protein
MELLVMCFVVAALVQHAAKDAFAGVTGRTFPSQAYRMKRLELRAARRSASGQAARRSPAREYFAGLWALAWDTQARRLERWGQERQDRWERRRAGEVVDAGRRRPAREFARVWWHTGPSQRWANAWQQASDRRRQKLEAANEPADRQPDAPAAPTSTPAAEPVRLAERAVGSGDRKEPEYTAEPTPGEAEQEPTHGDRETRGVEAAADIQTPNGTNEGTDDVTIPTMGGGPSLASGEAPNLDTKQAFVQSYATVFPAIKGAFLNFASTLAADEYGAGSQGAAVRAAEAVSAAEAAVAELAEVVCGAAVDIRDRAAATGFEVGRDALKQ